MTVICIDDKNKPNEIPNSQWIEYQEFYTVVKMCINKLTKDRYFVLEEVQPPAPYGGYNIKRFAFIGQLQVITKELEELQVEEVMV